MPSVAMTLTKVEVTVEGLPPGLIFQGKGLMALDGTKRKPERPPEKEAELRAHWVKVKGKKQLCIPSEMFYNSFCQAGVDFKDPNKKSRGMGNLIGATISIEPPRIPLGTAKHEVKMDWVRIPPRTGAMVEIGRPWIREWKASFTVTVDEEFWKAELLEGIIKHAGKRVGIGAWRPSLRGAYGKFVVVKFAVKR